MSPSGWPSPAWGTHSRFWSALRPSGMKGRLSFWTSTPAPCAAHAQRKLLTPITAAIEQKVAVSRPTIFGGNAKYDRYRWRKFLLSQDHIFNSLIRSVSSIENPANQFLACSLRYNSSVSEAPPLALYCWVEGSGQVVILSASVCRHVSSLRQALWFIHQN